ncbi:MAG: hypothetical protein B7Z81_02330 [Acidocella sp. 20-61-6]|nr:MAG: hypothetical protein B7Z81_02330 [Acidocella sp. 20-61-6]
MKYIPLACALWLAGCGTLPEPFYGNPGVTGARLAVPPPPVLIVPTPTNAMLGNDAAKLYANDLAAALVAADIPSIAKPADKTDWQIITTATLSGTQVIPHYQITGPDGKTYGNENGAGVDAAGWANGTPDTLNHAATTDAATLAKLLAAVNASIQQSNPNSLENRPARLFVAGVAGAPGDGNNALSLDITRDLPKLGMELVDKPAQADFIVNGIVKTKPDANNQTLVEIDWMIHDANNRKIGQVTQLHDLSLSDITPYWGDVAAAAATEGAGGIHEAVQNATLKKTSADK